MAISGIVIHLEPHESSDEAALHQLALEPSLSLGEKIGPCVAAVLDTANAEEDLEAFERIRSMHGVHHVDVVLVHFGDDAMPQGFENTGAGI